MREIKADLLPVISGEWGVRKKKVKKFTISVLFPNDIINGSSIKESFFKRIIP